MGKEKEKAEDWTVSEEQFWVLITVIVACSGYLEHRLYGIAGEVNRFRVQYLEETGRLRRLD